MRIVSCVCLALCLPALASAQGGAPSDARKIIDRAIQAVGGEANLAKFKMQTWSEKGTFYGMGRGLPYIGTYTVRWPDRFRMDIQDVYTMVVDGDKGWTKSQKEVADMGKEQLEREKLNLYGSQMATLLPLKDKAFTLTMVPEIQIDGKAAVGVKVSHKGRPDILLYFDKASGLLTKTERMVPPESPKGKEIKQETFLSDFKEVDGCKMPTKVVSKRDGKLYVEATLSDIKAPKMLDDKMFRKP